MATLKRKRLVGNAPSNKMQALAKKKKKVVAPPAPTKAMTVEEEMDAIIKEEEEAEDSGLTLQDLAAIDSDEEEAGEENGTKENKYYKKVDEDPLFEEDEEVQAYIESKKRGLLRPSINDKKALQLKLMEITDGAPWPETLQISAEEDLECDGILYYFLFPPHFLLYSSPLSRTFSTFFTLFTLSLLKLA